MMHYRNGRHYNHHGGGGGGIRNPFRSGSSSRGLTYTDPRYRGGGGGGGVSGSPRGHHRACAPSTAWKCALVTIAFVYLSYSSFSGSAPSRTASTAATARPRTTNDSARNQQPPSTSSPASSVAASLLTIPSAGTAETATLSSETTAADLIKAAKQHESLSLPNKPQQPPGGITDGHLDASTKKSEVGGSEPASPDERTVSHPEHRADDHVRTDAKGSGEGHEGERGEAASEEDDLAGDGPAEQRGGGRLERPSPVDDNNRESRPEYDDDNGADDETGRRPHQTDRIGSGKTDEGSEVGDSRNSMFQETDDRGNRVHSKKEHAGAGGNIASHGREGEDGASKEIPDSTDNVESRPGDDTEGAPAAPAGSRDGEDAETANVISSDQDPAADPGSNVGGQMVGGTSPEDSQNPDADGTTGKNKDEIPMVIPLPRDAEALAAAANADLSLNSVASPDAARENPPSGDVARGEATEPGEGPASAGISSLEASNRSVVDPKEVLPEPAATGDAAVSETKESERTGDAVKEPREGKLSIVLGLEDAYSVDADGLNEPGTSTNVEPTVTEQREDGPWSAINDIGGSTVQKQTVVKASNPSVHDSGKAIAANAVEKGEVDAAANETGHEREVTGSEDGVADKGEPQGIESVSGEAPSKGTNVTALDSQYEAVSKDAATTESNADGDTQPILIGEEADKEAVHSQGGENLTAVDAFHYSKEAPRDPPAEQEPARGNSVLLDGQADLATADSTEESQGSKGAKVRWTDKGTDSTESGESVMSGALGDALDEGSRAAGSAKDAVADSKRGSLPSKETSATTIVANENAKLQEANANELGKFLDLTGDSEKPAVASRHQSEAATTGGSGENTDGESQSIQDPPGVDANEEPPAEKSKTASDPSTRKEEPEAEAASGDATAATSADAASEPEKKVKDRSEADRTKSEKTDNKSSEPAYEAAPNTKRKKEKKATSADAASEPETKDKGHSKADRTKAEMTDKKDLEPADEAPSNLKSNKEKKRGKGAEKSDAGPESTRTVHESKPVDDISKKERKKDKDGKKEKVASPHIRGSDSSKPGEAGSKERRKEKEAKGAKAAASRLRGASKDAKKSERQ